MRDSLRLHLSSYPGMNRFVLDWLDDAGKARLFLPRDGMNRPVRRWAPDTRLVAALEASNRAWGIDASDALARWSSGTTYTIIAGQQVGFAGGPLYTLTKLATLVRLKRDLEREGVEVTPFFWLATEDHDFDEVATLQLPSTALSGEKEINRQLDLVTLRARSISDPRAAVGPLPVPESLVSELVALLDLPRPGWLREGITFRDSFAELIAAVFGSEVILVDALLPELRRGGAVLFDQIRRRDGEIQNALRVRGGELEAAGYAEQVVPRDGEEYTLLFDLDGEGRRSAPNASAAAEPERTSTSAITRPLLQDFVFAPDVFIGGPAEVAYYAQIGALHDLLGVTRPRVALRGHALLAPNRVLKAVDRYRIDPRLLFDSPEAILAGMDPEAVARVETIRDEAKRDLNLRISEIASIALPADHALARSINRSVGHLEYHFGKLSERAIRALVRRDRERWAALRDTVATLYPDRSVQERVVSWLPHWIASPSLVERLVEEIDPDSAYFRIIGI